MVFSFFKKQPQKMPERPAVRPRAPGVPPEIRTVTPLVEEIQPLEPLPDLEFTSGNMPPPPKQPAIEPATLAPAVDDLDFTDEDFDREFTESSVMAIDVDHGGDPVQADIEQIVVLYANGQDAVARSLLETLVRTYQGSDSRRFWRLLFELLEVTGDRTAFDKLGAEFAETCETSPPTWRQQQVVVSAPRVTAGSRLLVLQGVLTADGVQPVAELAALIKQKASVRLDCGKLIGCDDEVAGQLATLLTQARRTGVDVVLENAAAVLQRLSERLVVGQASSEPAWLLLLELLQRTSTQEIFEERAIDYAVTFERSPPSWELPRTTTAKVDLVAPALPKDDAYYLSGNLKNAKFDELIAVFAAQQNPVLDFSGVSRMDFFSAGQLVNRIAPYKAAGRDIVIRSPNHLVAELMAVVGLNKQARIIVPKS